MSLQIFEQRYLDLVRSCLKQDEGFGLVMITEGQEVAQPGREMPCVGEIGCYARIVDWDSLPNSLLGITIEGSRRFQLKSAVAGDSQLVMGEVAWLDDHAPVPLKEEWMSLVEVLKNLEQHPHVQRLGIDANHENAWEVGYALAQLLPVEEEIKYGLLGLEDVDEFIGELDDLLNELGGLTA